jgi:hypothetical protein
VHDVGPPIAGVQIPFDDDGGAMAFHGPTPRARRTLIGRRSDGSEDHPDDIGR